jgi:HlyD family type I secretion membrane fusion protein
LNSLQKSIHGIEIANSSLRLALNAKKSQVSALQAEYEVVLDLVKSEFTLDNSLDRSNGHQISDAPTQSALDGRKRQLSAVRSQYDSALKLVESGFVSANSLATSQIQLSQAETELLDYKSQVNQNKYRLQSQLSLVESEILESMARIAQNDQRINELKESMTTVRHEMALSKIRSPATGKVMNTSIKSAGLNITAGTQMMEIVPDSERLLIEARIPVDYATRAQVGMPVDVMFPTLPGSSTFRIKGTVEYLSADRLTDTQTNQIYLEGRVSLDEQASIDQLHLRAGLPASVLLNTGPRTLLSYITRPLTERMTKGLQ